MACSSIETVQPSVCRGECASRTSPPERSLSLQFGQTRTPCVSGGANTRAYRSVTNPPQLLHSGMAHPTEGHTGKCHLVVPVCGLYIRSELMFHASSNRGTAGQNRGSGSISADEAIVFFDVLADDLPASTHSTLARLSANRSKPRQIREIVLWKRVRDGRETERISPMSSPLLSIHTVG